MDLDAGEVGDAHLGREERVGEAVERRLVSDDEAREARADLHDAHARVLSHEACGRLQRTSRALKSCKGSRQGPPEARS